MNALTTYWLCRAQGSATEGPFTLGQLRAMYGTGAINAEALVCLNGEQEWTEARWLLEEGMSPPPLPESGAAMEERMRRFENELRREKKKNSTSGCTWGCLVLIVLFAFFGIVGSFLPKSKPSAAQMMRDSSAVKPSAWDGSVPEVKKFIERSVRDPNSLKYNQWENFTTSTNHITTVDFTAINGFGGPVRERWVFSFDKSTGQLQTVFNGNKFLYDATGAEVK